MFFPDATYADIDQSLARASGYYDEFRTMPGSKRATFLNQISSLLEKKGGKIVKLANEETSLGKPRLEMELVRTVATLKIFAQLAENEKWQNESMENPKEDSAIGTTFSKINLPIGIVVVIGACNFPLAISVVGTDTASALAVGCPVIVKSHPAHAATCQLLADLVCFAMETTGIAPGAFQLLHGKNHEITKKLVLHPKTSCVAFTGSFKGGRELAKIASRRQIPIPFHAEMGSLNPVIFSPKKILQETEQIAFDYVRAVNLYAGQMCTKPGILFFLSYLNFSSFIECVRRAVLQERILPMLNSEVHRSYEESIRIMEKETSLLATNEQVHTEHHYPAFCRIFKLEAKQFLKKPELRVEAFGPTSMLVLCKNEHELLESINSLEGSLTASLHCFSEEKNFRSKLIPILESKVGRLLWNGFPPGVISGPATHHGGPWPATTDSRYTSIGREAYKRFVRPLCKQGFPIHT